MGNEAREGEKAVSVTKARNDGYDLKTRNGAGTFGVLADEAERR